MVSVYIGVGSNLGDRRKNIENAVDSLKDPGCIDVISISSLQETEAVGGPPQGKYLNGVLEIHTDLSPFKLLKVLSGIETSLGRIRRERYGPRTIDLDILLYGDVIMENAVLTIPHPRMKEREFVLRPLREIAPHLDVFSEVK